MYWLAQLYYTDFSMIDTVSVISHDSIQPSFGFIQALPRIARTAVYAAIGMSSSLEILSPSTAGTETGKMAPSFNALFLPSSWSKDLRFCLSIGPHG